MYLKDTLMSHEIYVVYIHGAVISESSYQHLLLCTVFFIIKNVKLSVLKRG